AALGAQSDMKVLCTARCRAAALQAIRELAPDIAIVDNATPELDPLEILSTAAAVGCPTKVVVFTGSMTEGEARKAVAGGVRGIILKSAPLDQLISCVRQVCAGRPFFSQQFLNAAPQPTEKDRPMNRQGVEALTERQRQVAILVSRGNSNREIAQRL